MDLSIEMVIYSGFIHWKWWFIVDLPIKNGDLSTGMVKCWFFILEDKWNFRSTYMSKKHIYIYNMVHWRKNLMAFAACLMKQNYATWTFKQQTMSMRIIARSDGFYFDQRWHSLLLRKIDPEVTMFCWRIVKRFSEVVVLWIFLFHCIYLYIYPHPNNYL